MDKSTDDYLNEFKDEKLDEEKLRDAQKKAGNLGDVANAFLTLVAMAKAALSGKFPLTTAQMTILVGAIIYVVSPIDLIPDFIPVLGWTDDIGVVGLAAKKLWDAMEQFKKTQG